MPVCYHACSQLSIQNMMGGGRPAGGRHGNTRDTPSWTTIAFIFSFDHKGDPGIDGHTNLVSACSSRPLIDANVVRGARWRNKAGDCG